MLESHSKALLMAVTGNEKPASENCMTPRREQADMAMRI